MIGQACEFDYSGAQACRHCAKRISCCFGKFKSCYHYDRSRNGDATYIEPIHWQVVRKIIEKERPDAILPTMGGQTALNCALELERQGC